MYQVLSNWWGEEPGPQLASRVRDAPDEHLNEFRKAFPTEQILARARPSPRQEGDGFRPTFIRGDVASDQALATRLLLYSESLVVPTAVMAVDYVSTRFEREPLTSTLVWLCYTYPLWRTGDLQCADVSSHWKERLFFESLHEAAPSGILSSDSRNIWADGFMEDPLLGLARAFPGLDSDLLALSRAEDWFMRLVIVGARSRTARSADLTLLGRAELPTLDGTSGALVLLRQNEPAFAEWRVTLRESLAAVRQLRTSDTDPRELAGALQQELSDAIQPVSQVVGRSPSLQAMQRGKRSMGLAALGAAGGWVASGADPRAIAGGVLPGLGDIGLAMFEAARQHRKDALIWGLYASLL